MSFSMMKRLLLVVMVPAGLSRVVCRCHPSLYSTTCHAFSTRAKDDEYIWDSAYRQEVPRNVEEMTKLLREKVTSPPDPHLLKVAIVGVPNSGKSTLINKLMGWRVCSASRKVHTTQVNAKAVYNFGSTQMVFLDTPGLVTPQEVERHKLQRNLLIEPELSLQEADILGVVHDVSCHFTHSKLHSRLTRLLALHPTIPTVLILNKVDLLKSKGRLLQITRTLTEGVVGGLKFLPKCNKSTTVEKDAMIRRALLQDKVAASRDPTPPSESHPQDTTNTTVAPVHADNREDTRHTESLLGTSYDISHIKERDVFEGKVRLTEQQLQTFTHGRHSWPLFSDVFMISAKDGTGVDDLRDYLFTCARPHPWIFSPKVVTDQNPEEIAIMTVREKFLDYFKAEIPYSLQFSVEHWELTDTDLLSIIIKVQCGRKGLVRVLLGAGGEVVARMAQTAEQDLRNTFRSEVKLRLNVVFDYNLKKRLSRR